VATVNGQTHQPTFNLNYYQYGQMSKYVQPGATRIFSTRLVSDGYGVTPGVDDVAFVNHDGSKVLVAYNNAATSQPFAIEYRGKYLNWTMPAASTVTLTWR
jgi:glucosylceramidase